MRDIRITITAAVGAVALVAGLSACRESPTETPRDPRPAVFASAPARGIVTTAICTRTWRSAVSGTWSDPAMWNPTGTPVAADTVCIKLNGVYTVTMNSTATVGNVQLGGGVSTPQLDITGGGTLTARTRVEVFPGALLSMAPNYTTLNADYLDNSGIVLVSATGGVASATINARSFYNYGTTTLQGQTALTASGWHTDLTNYGTFEVNSPSAVHYAATPTTYSGSVMLGSGVVRGSQRLLIERGGTSTVPMAVYWWGGTIEGITSDPTTPVVKIVKFGDVYVDHSAVGTIGAVMRSLPDTNYILNLTNATLNIDGDNARIAFMYNYGTTHLYATNSTYTASRLYNSGSLIVHAATEFSMDTLLNKGSGTITAWNDLTFSKRLGRVWNYGTVTAKSSASVLLSNSTSWTSFDGTMQGKLVATDVTLSGTGSVGDVTGSNLAVLPGPSTAPFLGTLSANSLTLDARSGLTFDVAGDTPGSYDQLVVAGGITYGGKLTVNNIAPYVGGTCGQVVTLITDNSTTPRGSFASTGGFAPSLGHAWRAYNPKGQYAIAGFNPFGIINASRLSLAAAEGGAGDAFTVCFGSRPPTASVTLSYGSALGQVVTTPGPVTFSTVDWVLPRVFSVSAVDDATVEALMTDDLVMSTTSTDPYYNAVGVASPSVTVSDNDGNADLTVAMLEVPASTTVGTDFTIVLQVTNNGPTLSTGATVSLPALVGLEVVSAGTNGNCNWSASSVTCTSASLAVGAKQNLLVTLHGLAVGSYANTVSVTGQQPDAVGTNNSATKTFVVK